MPQLIHKIVPARKPKTYEKWTVVAMVSSSREDGSSYTVYKRGFGEWKCTCMAYRFAQGKVGAKIPCKHLRRLFQYAQRLGSGEVKSVGGITVVEQEAM
jgi:hypothetical protein